jgi:hypothetical protein
MTYASSSRPLDDVAELYHRRMNSNGSRTMMLRPTRRLLSRLAVFLCGTTGAMLAQPAPASLDDPDISLLYNLAQRVQAMAEVCQQQLPDVSAGVPAALSTWNTRHARVQLDALVERTARRRAAMGRSMLRMSGPSLLGADPRAACANFGSYVSTAQYDLGLANPNALTDARRKLGAPPLVATTSEVQPTAGATASVNAPVNSTAQTAPTTVAGDAASSQVAVGEPPPVEISSSPTTPVTTRTPPTRRGGREPARQPTRPASREPEAATTTVATAPLANGEPPDVEISPARSGTSPTRTGAQSTPQTSPALPATAGPPERTVSALMDVVGPAGWSKQPGSGGGVIFRNPPTDSSKATLFIFPDQSTGGASLDSALQRFLVATLRDRLDMKDEFKYGGPSTAITMRGQLMAYDDIDPDFPDSRDGMNVLAVAISRGGGRYTPVMMITPDDRHKYDLKKTFAAWFRTVVLPGDVGARWSLAGRARPGPFKGLYMGSSLTNQINIYGGMDLIANRHYATFFRNGIVYSALPDAGQIDNMDFAKVCTEEPENCGTYYVQGKQLISQFPNNIGGIDVDTSEVFEPGDPTTGMRFSGQSLFKVAPVAAMRLDGEFTSIDGTSSGPNGSLMISKSIHFFPDGRYESTSAVGFTSTPGGLASDNGTVVGYVPGSERIGTYTIEGYTLTLKPQQGPTRYATILFFDDERPVKSVLIDDSYYKR